MKIKKSLLLVLLATTSVVSCKNDSKTREKEPVAVESVVDPAKKEPVKGQWIIDKDHSKLAFVVTHHGISEVDGYFKKFEAKVTAQKQDLSDATFDITVETASVFTDLDERDNELRQQDMFNVEKFPVMTFKSTSVKKIEGNKFVIKGDLTIKNITKQITLDATINGPMAHPNPENKSLQFGIKAEGVLKRSDFAVGGGLTSAFVSDEVKIRATAGFEKY